MTACLLAAGMASFLGCVILTACTGIYYQENLNTSFGMCCAVYFDVSRSIDQAKLRQKTWGKQKINVYIRTIPQPYLGVIVVLPGRNLDALKCKT
jgi:CTP:molybdopterin cytidylyltransferase MocA